MAWGSNPFTNWTSQTYPQQGFGQPQGQTQTYGMFNPGAMNFGGGSMTGGFRPSGQNFYGMPGSTPPQGFGGMSQGPWGGWGGMRQSPSFGGMGGYPGNMAPMFGGGSPFGGGNSMPMQNSPQQNPFASQSPSYLGGNRQTLPQPMAPAIGAGPRTPEQVVSQWGHNTSPAQPIAGITATMMGIPGNPGNGAMYDQAAGRWIMP